MRALLFLVFAFGVTMSTVADEKKKEPETLKEGDRVWTERCTIKVWVEKQKAFLNPVKDVWAMRKDTKEGLMFDVRAINGNSTPDKGSVIIDSQGREYTVLRAESPPYGLFVKLTKDAPKKPQ